MFTAINNGLKTASPVLLPTGFTPVQLPTTTAYPLLGNTDQSTAPMALNAGTTYGMDVSMQNNYGLGSNYVSPTQSVAQAKQKKAEPSAWWLAAFLAFLWVI